MTAIVTRTICAGDVRKGDDLQGRIVAETKVGSKWTSIRDDDGKLIIRCLSDQHLEVSREEKTDEEKKAERHEYAVESLRKYHDTATAKDPVSMLRAMADEADGKNWRRAFDWSNGASFLKAQAEWNVVMSCEYSRASLVEKGVDEDTALLAAYGHRLFPEAGSYDYPRDPLSKSTSVISNILDDLDTVAPQLVWQDVKYSVSRDILEEAVAAATAIVTEADNN